MEMEQDQPRSRRTENFLFHQMPHKLTMICWWKATRQ